LGYEVRPVSDVTVLLIDEHDDVRALLSRGLSSYPPIKVVAATRSAMKGIQLAESLAPDVILVDLRKRGQYSVETYSRIARASTGSRIVVYTSYLTPEEEKAARAAGACVCLLKGLSLKDLAGRLVDVATGPIDVAPASGLGLRSA
jgi:NarL family two-component system response regulator LiaR